MNSTTNTNTGRMSGLMRLQRYKADTDLTGVFRVGEFEVPMWLYGIVMHILSTTPQTQDFSHILPILNANGINVDLRILQSIAHEWLNIAIGLRHAWAHTRPREPAIIPDMFRVAQAHNPPNPQPQTAPEPDLTRRQALLDQLGGPSPYHTRVVEENQAANNIDDQQPIIADDLTIVDPVLRTDDQLTYAELFDRYIDSSNATADNLPLTIRDPARSRSPTPERIDPPVRVRTPLPRRSVSPTNVPHSPLRRGASTSIRSALDRIASVVHRPGQHRTPDDEPQRTISRNLRPFTSGGIVNTNVRQNTNIPASTPTGLINPYDVHHQRPNTSYVELPFVLGPYRRLSPLPDNGGGNEVDALSNQVNHHFAQLNGDIDLTSGDDAMDIDSSSSSEEEIFLYVSTDEAMSDHGNDNNSSDDDMFPLPPPSSSQPSQPVIQSQPPPPSQPRRRSQRTTRGSQRPATPIPAAARSRPAAPQPPPSMVPPTTSQPQQPPTSSTTISTNPPLFPRATNIIGRPITLTPNATPDQVSYFMSQWQPGQHLPDGIPGYAFRCPIPGCGKLQQYKRDARRHFKYTHAGQGYPEPDQDRIRPVRAMRVPGTTRGLVVIDELNASQIAQPPPQVTQPQPQPQPQPQAAPPPTSTPTSTTSTSTQPLRRSSRVSRPSSKLRE